MAVNLERFVKGKRFTQDHTLDDASDQILIKTTAGSSVGDAIAAAAAPLATTTVAGLIEEATGEETRLGATDANRADRAVTPESMSYTLQTQKNYGIYTRTSANGLSTLLNMQVDGATAINAGGDFGGPAFFGIYNSTAAGKAASSYNLVSPTCVAPAGTFFACSAAGNGASGDGTKYGYYADTNGSGGTNIGVYGRASGGATNWAGYFDGNTYTSGNAGFGVSPAYKVDVNGVIRGNATIWSKVPEGSQAEFVLTRGTTATWTMYIPSAAGVGDLRFYNGVDRIIFDQNGGINTGSSVTASSFITSSDETLKENVEAIDAAKALQFRNGLQWKKYELFSEQQVEIMEEVTEEVQKTDAAGNPVVDADGNPVMETLTKQVGTGRYEVKRNSQGIKRGLIAQEVLALAQSIGDFSDVVVEVGEYFTLDAQGYPVKDAQGNNIVNKRLGLDYDAIQFVICAGEQSLLPAVV